MIVSCACDTARKRATAYNTLYTFAKPKPCYDMLDAGRLAKVYVVKVQ